MNEYALLVSPLAKGAFFADYLTVASAELAWVTGLKERRFERIGGMDFLRLEADEALLPQLLALSWVQGVFRCEAGVLVPLDAAPVFDLHEDFVYGAKFKGKTNEMLTQMLLNVGLAALDAGDRPGAKVLDPMCGRATTLLWAMRYGLKARGIEQDPRALGEIRQNVKKWCKVHRQKHAFREGFIGKANKAGHGKFIEFEAERGAMRVISGDSTQAGSLLNGETFQLIVSDLPYGVAHFTTDKTRNPLAVLEACAEPWQQSLKVGGAMVLAFNRYLPKREELLSVFQAAGLHARDFVVPHRVSESIHRDVVVLTRPR